MVLVVVLLGGCMRACSCGGKEQAARGGASDEESADHAASPSGEAGNGESSASPSGPGPAREAQQYTPAPDSKLTRQLIAARTEIDKGKTFPKLGAPADIAAVLVDHIGEYHGVGAASSAQRAGSGTEIVVAARNYVHGKHKLRVKIVDTARSPEARRAVSEHLAEIGNAAAGNQHGAFVRGYPAVVADYEQDRASRASALIGDRYLVQVLVTEPSSPDEALHMIEMLDWGKLAPKQGKVVAAKP